MVVSRVKLLFVGKDLHEVSNGLRVYVLGNVLHEFKLRGGEREFGYKKVSHGPSRHLLTLYIGLVGLSSVLRRMKWMDDGCESERWTGGNGIRSNLPSAWYSLSSGSLIFCSGLRKSSRICW